MKTNFKKLFMSILACISVVPSANFKAAAIAEPSEIVNINTAQDWIDIAGRTDQDEHYTEGKCFILADDIVLDIRNFTDLNDADNNIINAFQHMVSLTPDTPGYTPLDTSDPQVIEATDEYAMALIQRPSIDWNCLYGTLDGNNHTITVIGSEEEDEGYAIRELCHDGRVRNVNFVTPGPAIETNYGVIDLCRFSHGTVGSGDYLTDCGVNGNEGSGVISNCVCGKYYVAGYNLGVIGSCRLFINNARKAQLDLGHPVRPEDEWISENIDNNVDNAGENQFQLGDPDRREGSFDIWNSENVQRCFDPHYDEDIEDGGIFEDCEIWYHNPQLN